MSSTLEIVSELPRSTWDIGRRDYYFRLGCVGCENAVCVQATDLYSDELDDLKDILSLVDKTIFLAQGFGMEYQDACITPCEAEIPTVLEILDERFESSLAEDTTAAP